MLVKREGPARQQNAPKLLLILYWADLLVNSFDFFENTGDPQSWLWMSQKTLYCILKTSCNLWKKLNSFSIQM